MRRFLICLLAGSLFCWGEITSVAEDPPAPSPTPEAPQTETTGENHETKPAEPSAEIPAETATGKPTKKPLSRLNRTRSGRIPQNRAKLVQGLFGAEEPESPKPQDTQLGGTVPEIWSIPASAWHDEDEMTPIFERDTLAPAVPGKVLRYANWLMQRYDKNADGVWQQEEWKKLPGAPQAMDVDGDLQITLEELVRFLALYGQNRTIHKPNPPESTFHSPRVVSSQFQLFKPFAPLPTPPPAPVQSTVDGAAETAKPVDKSAEKPTDLSEDELKEGEDETVDDATYEEIAAGQQVAATKKYHTNPEALKGVPMWFFLRDKDGDGQISIPEFAPTLSAQALALFGKLDKNGDGFITPDEVKPAQ